MADAVRPRSDDDGRPVAERMSRRTVMKIGAGAGIAGALAIGTTGVAFADHTSNHDAGQPSHGDWTNDPLVVHVIDASAGTAEVFTRSSRRQIKDHDLVARIMRAARA